MSHVTSDCLCDPEQSGSFTNERTTVEMLKSVHFLDKKKYKT